MTTRIPVTTLSNFRQNLVPPSLQDLLYIQQGSEHDRDSAITLGQLLGTQVIQSFLNDRENWRTFTASEAGIITLGDYQRNVIIVPSAKDQALRIDHFPTNGLIIYAPDWDVENSVTGITIREIHDINRSFTITKGGVGVFYSFGPDQPVIGQSLIGSSALSLAVLKELYVDKLIVKSDVALQYGSNAAFEIRTEERVVGETTYYDLVIGRANGSSKIKILGDTLQIKAWGFAPSEIDFDDGFKNFWKQIGSDDFKTLNAEHINSDLVTAEHINSDLVSSKRRVYKDVDISGSGDSLSSSQTQYETSLGHSTSFYYLGIGAYNFTFDKTTCEIGEEVLLYTPVTANIRSDKDDNNNYWSREIVGNSLIKMVYFGLNQYGNARWIPLTSSTPV